jgi:hypothetical protein
MYYTDLYTKDGNRFTFYELFLFHLLFKCDVYNSTEVMRKYFKPLYLMAIYNEYLDVGIINKAS